MTPIPTYMYLHGICGRVQKGNPSLQLELSIFRGLIVVPCLHACRVANIETQKT